MRLDTAATATAATATTVATAATAVAATTPQRKAVEGWRRRRGSVATTISAALTSTSISTLQAHRRAEGRNSQASHGLYQPLAHPFAVSIPVCTSALAPFTNGEKKPLRRSVETLFEEHRG